MAPLHETVRPYRAIFKMSGLAMSTTIGIAHRLREACDGHPHAKIEWPHRILHEAADEIELLRTQLDIAITALRRVVSLAEKNVPKYAQEIASEGLRYPVGREQQP